MTWLVDLPSCILSHLLNLGIQGWSLNLIILPSSLIEQLAFLHLLTQLFMLETWESILTITFSHSQSLTASYLLELSYVILRTFCFSPNPHMPPINPSHHHLLLHCYHSLLISFPKSNPTTLQSIFHVSIRVIFSFILLKLRRSISSIHLYFSWILKN